MYHNEGNGLFIDDAPRSSVGRASLLTLTFGCFFFDYDLDGRPDIFAANGHVADDIEAVQSRVTYAQRPHLFRNLGQGRFDDVAPDLGPGADDAVWSAAARRTATSTTTATSTSSSPSTTVPARLLRNEARRRSGVVARSHDRRDVESRRDRRARGRH